MKHFLIPLALLLGGVLAPPVAAADEGFTPPEFKAVKWYNSPELTLADLRERAVLFEVFRTW